MKKLLVIFTVLFAATESYCAETYLSEKDYEQSMGFIRAMSPDAHAKLEDCKMRNGVPCLKEGQKSSLDISTVRAYGYPLLILTYDILFNPKQKSGFCSFIDQYADYKAPIIEEEREAFLQELQSIASELYEEFRKIDPTAKDHIIRYPHSAYNNAAYVSRKDGLPVIAVGTGWLDSPARRWALAHELGHYVLGHLGIIERKKTTGPLDFKELAKEDYSNNKEYEADKFAIVDLRISLDDPTRAHLEEYATKQSKEYDDATSYEKATFESTHPLWKKRIKYMEHLEREIKEYKDYYGDNPTPIDWASLAEEYRNKLTIKK